MVKITRAADSNSLFPENSLQDRRLFFGDCFRLWSRFLKYSLKYGLSRWLCPARVWQRARLKMTRAWSEIRNPRRTGGRDHAPQVEPWMIRPFEPCDLGPVPPNWRIGPPHFVGIGWGKAGTSWWYALLTAHPSVKPNRLRTKELAYFSHFGYRGLPPEAVATYRQAFAAPAGCVCGEWSPGYITYPLAIDYLAQAAPQARLIAVVRNPVDRMLSVLNQWLCTIEPFLELDGDRATVFERFSLFNTVMLTSFLHRPFQHVLQRFDRSQLLLLQYERCKQQPLLELQKTYRFLEINDAFVPPDLTRPVNVRSYQVPQLLPEERQRLADYFREDVTAFARQFPEIDLSLWTDFSERASLANSGRAV